VRARVYICIGVEAEQCLTLKPLRSTEGKKSDLPADSYRRRHLHGALRASLYWLYIARPLLYRLRVRVVIYKRSFLILWQGRLAGRSRDKSKVNFYYIKSELGLLMPLIFITLFPYRKLGTSRCTKDIKNFYERFLPCNCINMSRLRSLDSELQLSFTKCFLIS
jgi:hypothetical protein